MTETKAVATVDLMGMQLAALDQRQVLEHVFCSLDRGQGGWIVTANLDFLRRHVKDPEVRELYDAADLRVADGMPLLWAARMQGQSLPERIAGSSLIWELASGAAQRGRTLYLLGGQGDAGAAATAVLRHRFPTLTVAGRSNPWFSDHPTPQEIEAVLATIVPAHPDILLVGLGSPKQERVIRALRSALPHTWMIGIGITFSFVAGDVSRAPPWMQHSGLEWIHRLFQEPRRLGRRYIIQGLPFAARLFATAALGRVRNQSPG